MFNLFLATPEKKIVSDSELAELTVPGHAGELNILPGHSPLMTRLDPGLLKYRLQTGQVGQLAISWGYCQVNAQGVSVLVEKAVEAADIDAAAVAKEIKNLEDMMGSEFMTEDEWAKASRNLSTVRAQAALKALR
jgi:F-type H+-transporting ATPase subunit epsilon